MLERQSAIPYYFTWLCNQHYQARDPEFGKSITDEQYKVWADIRSRKRSIAEFLYLAEKAAERN
jgi:hypothetical protein